MRCWPAARAKRRNTGAGANEANVARAEAAASGDAAARGTCPSRLPWAAEPHPGPLALGQWPRLCVSGPRHLAVTSSSRRSGAFGAFHTSAGSRALTRFAPAPTGYLHLGHVFHAKMVWQHARATGARVLLRIEDHDRERCRPEYERAILDDLDWLGFAPDLFPTDAFRAGRCDSRQSDRLPIYEAAAAELTSRGLIYGCTCSRQEIAAAASSNDRGEARERDEDAEPREANAEPCYSGTCRDRGIALGPGVSWRLRMDPGSETFDDLICGPQTQDPAAQCGDVSIRDRKGNWTYQFVASVDDFKQGIDLVVRGRDLLASSGRQIRIARLLGRPVPATFAHHDLIMKSPTRKLSKSDGDTGIRDLRAAGLTREQVLAMAGGT
jgi:glutamyl/glutaminyl-tRNA synthetase